MNNDNLIPLNQLCIHYKVEMSFFNNLKDFGLIEVLTIQQDYYIRTEQISELEKMIRMHQELNINIEGIDTVLNLLNKIESLNSELLDAQNRLRRYEG